MMTGLLKTKQKVSIAKKTMKCLWDFYEITNWWLQDDYVMTVRWMLDDYGMTTRFFKVILCWQVFSICNFVHMNYDKKLSVAWVIDFLGYRYIKRCSNLYNQKVTVETIINVVSQIKISYKRFTIV